MRKTEKRTYHKNKVLLLLVLLFFTSVLSMTVGISADAATKHSQSEAIAWVQSQIGKSIDYDNVNGAQCVDLIKAYYNYLGVSPASGNGADYTGNALPNGWQRLQGAVPQKGDILIYTGGYGHVAIFESTNVTYHQNFGNPPHQYVEKITYAYNSLANPYWGVIRPDFSSKWYSSMTPVNVGENFYTHIIKNDGWADIGNVNDDVKIVDGKAARNDNIWNFVRQSDGSYVIYSCKDWKVLTAYFSGTADGTNVMLSPCEYADNQKWYIYGSGSGDYKFRPKYSDKVIDIFNNENALGTNVQLWTYNNSEAQKFALWKVDKIGSTTLSVVAGTSTAETRFSWTKVDKAILYDLVILKGSPGNVTHYKTKWNITDTTYDLLLPEGYYEVYVNSCNAYSYQGSNTVKFNVKKGVNNVGTTNLSVVEGDNETPTVFKWDAAQNATRYDLEILKTDPKDHFTGALEDYEAYKKINDINNLSYSIQLPKGYYMAYVIAKNASGSKESNRVSFRIDNIKVIDDFDTNLNENLTITATWNILKYPKGYSIKLKLYDSDNSEVELCEINSPGKGEYIASINDLKKVGGYNSSQKYYGLILVVYDSHGEVINEKRGFTYNKLDKIYTIETGSEGIDIRLPDDNGSLACDQWGIIKYEKIKTSDGIYAHIDGLKEGFVYMYYRNYTNGRRNPCIGIKVVTPSDSDKDKNPGESNKPSGGSSNITETEKPNKQSSHQSESVTKPKKVKRVCVGNFGRKKLQVYWNEVQDCDGYEVQYALNKSFKKGKKTKKCTSSGIRLKKLKNNRTYYVRVRAYKIYNGKKVYGSWSKKKHRKVKNKYTL